MNQNNLHKNHDRSFTDYLFLTGKGFCMGASDVVPGVSGGTIAFILGIYEELITAIKAFDLYSVKLLLSFRFKAFFNHISWQFLLSIAIGIILAIFSLSKVISWLLQYRPVLIWSFFLGLILASVVIVFLRVKKWSSHSILYLLMGSIGAYLLVGLVPVSTPNTPFFLFLCGAFAICAMILPGISGSFILVILGKYQFILEAVNQRNFTVLLFVAAGTFVGIASFSRLLKWLLTKYHDLTIALLIGFMIGSLRKVWPWKETVKSIQDAQGKIIPVIQTNILPEQLNGEVILAIFIVFLGLGSILIMDRFSNQHS